MTLTNDELMQYYKICDQLRANREKQKHVQLEILFLNHIKKMVERLIARGVPEQEAFETVKKIVMIVDKITPDPPKDPLQ